MGWRWKASGSLPWAADRKLWSQPLGRTAVQEIRSTGTEKPKRPQLFIQDTMELPMSVFPGVWALLGVGVCVGKTTGEGLLPSHYTGLGL